jgi:hypothetical protein
MCRASTRTWRFIERDDVQAVEKVLAEVAALDLFFEVLVGGGDDAHAHLNELGGAHRFEALLFEGAEDLGLGLEAHVADFVQEQRAAVGFLELTSMRSSEARGFMAWRAWATSSLPVPLSP